VDQKSLFTLELPKILERLAGYTSFSAGAALAHALAPTTDLTEAQRWQQETSEARKLLDVKTDVTIGGARDVRPAAVSAARGGVLTTAELMDIKGTIIAARNLRRTLARLRDQFPRLSFMAEGLAECPGVVEAISRTIDERGEVFDSASEKLGTLRRELRAAHDRMLSKLQAIIGNSRNLTYLQEPIITQREGRYVIPIKADFKGRIRGIVHDQSASGATLFIEPLAIHDLANTWRSLQLQEMEEIRRILAELSAQIGEQAEDIGYTVSALADLDLAFAKAKYAEALRANEPELRPISPAQSPISNPQSPVTTRTHPGSIIKLMGARHPLLDQASVVPIDVVLGDGASVSGAAGQNVTPPYALVITGPNTGGKTVSLKTVGLLILMAQAGLHLPAQSGSVVSVFDDVFADIGDEQSIEQSLSTFSSHVTNIIGILKQAGAHSLVILDELGAGTDPGEGSALARAILSYLLDVGATTLVATHYPELKAFAHTTPGVANASVEFDLETLAPTYHLTIGLPGRSNAFAIASRLGLDSSIIDDARTMVTATDREAETLLDEIHRQRDAARAERAEAEAQRALAADHERKLAARLDAVDAERQALLDSARAEAQAELEEARAELAEARRRVRRAVETATPAAPTQEAEAALEEVEEKLEAIEDAPRPMARPVARPERVRRAGVRLGDVVYLPALRAEGQIIALTPTEAEVQVGRLRVKAKLSELSLRDESSAPSRASAKSQISNLPATQPQPPAPAPSPGLELDLRGQTVEDALPELERYLDAAYLAGLPWVRIIHGKGTGKLRQAVRDELRQSPLVKSHEAGADAEGGEGVTVARLALTD
jgi:DNA mismatch repair protein MutS2